MTSLVFGANGQVGQELLRALAPLGNLLASTRTGLLPDGSTCLTADFSDPESVVALLDATRPTRVINAAAYTAVDKAESEAAAAHAANAAAPGAIAHWCAAHAVPLVHYSTDYVFDGSGTRPYRPDDATAPLGVYGASKLAGEEAIRATGGRHLIFRTAWVYAAHGQNFLRTMLRVGAERDVLRVVADQIGTPTPAALIADVTARVLGDDNAASGTWHLTAAGETSWHGFAQAIFDGAVERGLIARAPTVEAITTADYPTPARRPAYSRLDTGTLEDDFGITLPDWRTALGGVLDEMCQRQMQQG
ncbi:dTDP-4-dehydrorhamnose reductase [Luteimonas fraxinea]|uniref:dTDP-4-dehydrorhamnose reductase n=1 Tax=Luteimonas fraxinea TaxID=2901869 RepID=A0ABS8UHN7_9GAMM|nr:dTDP-4-dehydrorhamnose reductase [Luteimonas fraxinea]MCD9098579.1 dTDP-4-dehydrorhamnose reductase [Luteimonas fraxinea]MCD9127312.1 dTDP-4-dehydrorhamnose reductase [Luteimonas fraxinea]UHH09018.1 dTDP-4-dehydrorhamnose reductase [Luteimonas fraxinea]